MMIRFSRIDALLLVGVLVFSGSTAAGPIRDRLLSRQQQSDSSEMSSGLTADLFDLGGSGRAMSCRQWAEKVSRLQAIASRRNPGPSPDIQDKAYGGEALEKLDIYFPPSRKPSGGAPILIMVHGGGWCVGDKGSASITENKVARWTPKGFLFVSVNYPMVNDGKNALAQAKEVAKAIAFVQDHALEWGGDPARVILMGHSAGAHLVSLVNADVSIRQAYRVRPVLGTISLDAGAIDVVKQMPQVYPFLKERYREAFGDSEDEWKSASPYHRFDRSAAPWLGVCSTQRKDDPCAQADAYVALSRHHGVKAEALPVALGHGAINKELGLPGDYTRQVELFMAGLDPVIARLLDPH